MYNHRAMSGVLYYLQELEPIKSISVGEVTSVSPAKE